MGLTVWEGRSTGVQLGITAGPHQVPELVKPQSSKQPSECVFRLARSMLENRFSHSMHVLRQLANLTKDSLPRPEETWLDMSKYFTTAKQLCRKGKATGP